MDEAKFKVGQRVRYRIADYPEIGQTKVGDGVVQNVRYSRRKSVISDTYKVKPDGDTKHLPFGAIFIKEHELEAL